jgi:hypothetical protein
MRAHTITIMSRRRRRTRRRALALVLAVCALAIPASASGYSSVNSITGGSSEPSATVGSNKVGSGHSSLNAITGPAPGEPTLATGPPPDTADGFDWPSALVGAGSAMALVALGGAAFLTVRRRTEVSPSASTS